MLKAERKKETVENHALIERSQRGWTNFGLREHGCRILKAIVYLKTRIRRLFATTGGSVKCSISILFSKNVTYGNILLARKSLGMVEASTQQVGETRI